MKCPECPYTLHAPQTDEGLVVWAVIRRCGGQVRAALGGPYALDFGAILAMGSAMGADIALLADLLPSIEPVIVKAYREEADDAG